MSPKIDSPRPPQLPRLEVPSPVSSTGAKAEPATSSTPRPISDGFTRAAPSAAAQASKAARLEGIGTQLAEVPGTYEPNGTGTNPEPYQLDKSMQGTTGGPQGTARYAAGVKTGSGTLPPKDQIAPELQLKIIETVKQIPVTDLEKVKTPEDLRKLVAELSSQFELPEGVSQETLDEFITEQILARMEAEGIETQGLGGKTGP
jgi:hypothetical protein